MTEKFQTYFKEVQENYKTLDTTEFTYRTSFENFLKKFDKDCHPRQGSKTEKIIGAPDFKIFKATKKIGYIETKDLDENLDKVLMSAQLKKYLAGINNLILTNYSRFILLRNGEKILDLSLFAFSDLNNPKYKISVDRIVEFNKMFDNFFNYKSLSIKTSEVLATELSKRAILIRDFAKEQLEEDRILANNNENYSSIFDFYQGLQELIHDISIDDTIDAYAQTITYGLFYAKTKCPMELTLESVENCLPKNIPIIQRIFKDITGTSLPSKITWIFDEILEVLNSADIKTIMLEMDVRGKKDRDPFMHFYEDFLRLYDPEKREKRGVYFTPRPIVNYIVQSVEWIIKNNFGKQLGFADDEVTTLDPATGTGSFLYLIYLRVFNELKGRGLNGLIRSKIKTHILKDFYGLEILITPYIIAHLQLSLLLKKWFYELDEGERVQIYLTNSLEQGEEHGLIPFMREINQERKVANDLIMKRPILAIIGNPPYSVMSANKGKWIDDLLKKGYVRADKSIDDGYYKVDGQVLGERNPKMLQDDYVKFIRLAQWKIDRSGLGVVGFITNNGYLDNKTFNGMRQSLLQSFDRIYILNLHGDKKKKEKCPDGSVDDNVFDIQKGTAIVLLVKNPEIKDKRIYYQDLYGLWQEKYKWLDRNTVYSTNWIELTPTSPDYYFIPFNHELNLIYSKYWKISDIFLKNTNGVQTARDNFTIKWTPQEVLITITKFTNLNPEKARLVFDLGDDIRDWKVELAQKDLIETGLSKEKILPIIYRPFDIRYTYYTGKTCGFHSMPRGEIMPHMLKQNIGLITRRQMISGRPCTYFFVTDKIISDGCIRSDNKGQESLFPLYLYQPNGSRTPNLNSKFLDYLSNLYGEFVQPEDILYYIYGVFYSNKYRKKFCEILIYDFPRIPFPKKFQIFKQICDKGKELVELHLMKKQLIPTIKYEIAVKNNVESMNYVEGKVYINKAQYFENIPEEVWTFYVGGYKVLEKWLKSRKNRDLSVQEISHFIQIIEVLKETLRIMDEIDKIDFLSD
jgi:predicted helicase